MRDDEGCCERRLERLRSSCEEEIVSGSLSSDASPDHFFYPQRHSDASNPDGTANLQENNHPVSVRRGRIDAY